MRLGMIMLIRLSINCRVCQCRFCCAVGGDVFITCPCRAT